MKLRDVKSGTIIATEIGGARGEFIVLSLCEKYNVVNCASWKAATLPLAAEVEVLGNVGIVPAETESRPIAAGVVCKCDQDGKGFCPMHGKRS